MSEQTKQIGQVAWDAVHNHGAFRRDFPNDDYLEAVGAAVLAAVGQVDTVSELRAARAETWDEAVAAVFAWWSAPEGERPALIVNPYGTGAPVNEREGTEREDGSRNDG